ncbi:hypothetical protein IscW_ISCW022598, partial [Ixodes scapularis]
REHVDTCRSRVPQPVQVGTQTRRVTSSPAARLHTCTARQFARASRPRAMLSRGAIWPAAKNEVVRACEARALATPQLGGGGDGPALMKGGSNASCPAQRSRHDERTLRAKVLRSPQRRGRIPRPARARARYTRRYRPAPR